MTKQALFKIKIDPDKCKGCRLCVIFCPKAAIKLSKKLNKKGIQVVEIANPALCTGCSNCAIMCPDCAIEIEKND